MVTLSRKVDLVAWRHQVTEMAVDKKRYKAAVYGEAPQIAQNWCLCKYCQLYRPDLMDNSYRHWRSELRVHINNLNKISLEKPKHRAKMTHEAMVVDSELGDGGNVYNVCRVKFSNENSGEFPLNITVPQQKEMCSLFAANIGRVVQCVGSSDIDRYLNIEFPI